jgi:hypothetical protein
MGLVTVPGKEVEITVPEPVSVPAEPEKVPAGAPND